MRQGLEESPREKLPLARGAHPALVIYIDIPAENAGDGVDEIIVEPAPVVEVPAGPAVVEPLIYTFSTDRLVFPLHISSIIKGDSLISLFFITPPNLPWDVTQAEELGFRAGMI